MSKLFPNRKRLLIFLVLLILPIYTFMGSFTKGLITPPTPYSLQILFLILSLPSLIMAKIIDTPICSKFFDYKLNDYYYYCYFYESPLFNYFLFLSFILTAFIMALVIENVIFYIYNFTRRIKRS